MNIVLDCDPGFDDWFVWLLLERIPDINLQAVLLSHGNAPLDQVERNALAISRLHGFNTNMYRGAASALNGGALTAQDVLGASGMRSEGAPLNFDRPLKGQEAGQNHGHLQAPDALDCLNWTQTIWLVTGPLTNLALALARGLRPARVVWMGGSTDRGNHSPAAEFNALADPEAAAQVFASGIDITMVGLNVCRQVSITQNDLAVFRTLRSQPAQIFTGYLDGYQRIRSKDGAVPMPLYDPVAFAALVHPEWFGFEQARVDVECKGEFTRGMTVCDFKRRDGRSPNASVATTVQAEKVRDWLLQAALNALESD